MEVDCRWIRDERCGMRRCRDLQVWPSGKEVSRTGRMVTKIMRALQPAVQSSCDGGNYLLPTQCVGGRAVL
jgi:hypothetical protein